MCITHNLPKALFCAGLYLFQKKSEKILKIKDLGKSSGKILELFHSLKKN